jgi:hypothetical protein
MTLNYERVIAEHARLTVLRMLARQPAYAANDSVLFDALGAYGFRLSRDRVGVEIDWLAEQGLVAAEPVGGLAIVTATRRGLDVAAGRAVVAGVKRPSPED